MVISILPQMPPVLASGTTYTYEFNQGFANNTKLNGYKYADTNNVWEWADSNPTVKGAANAYAHSWGGICTNTTDVGQWLALKIRITEPGIYSASLLHGKTSPTSNGGYGHIYLLPGDTKDIASALTEDNKIGTDIEYFADEQKKDAITPLSDNITIEENEVGEHILVFYASKKKYANQMYPDTLTLTKKQVGGDSSEPETEYCGYKAIYDFMQTANDGRDTTLLSTKNFWGFGGVNDGWETDADSFKKRSYGLQVQKLASGNWFALLINVPAAGTYKLSLGHITAAQGGVSRLYVMPKGTNVSQGLSNPKYKLENTVDFYSDVQSAAPVESLVGDYTFKTSGEHLLVFTYIGNSPNYTGEKTVPHIIFHTSFLTAETRHFPCQFPQSFTRI